MLRSLAHIYVYTDTYTYASPYSTTKRIFHEVWLAIVGSQSHSRHQGCIHAYSLTPRVPWFSSSATLRRAASPGVPELPAWTVQQSATCRCHGDGGIKIDGVGSRSGQWLGSAVVGNAGTHHISGVSMQDRPQMKLASQAVQ